jgi:hypothetical protein
MYLSLLWFFVGIKGVSARRLFPSYSLTFQIAPSTDQRIPRVQLLAKVIETMNQPEQNENGEERGA